MDVVADQQVVKGVQYLDMAVLYVPVNARWSKVCPRIYRGGATPFTHSHKGMVL